MITIDLTPAAEARVARFLAERDPEAGVPAAGYVLMMLADILQLDSAQLRSALERTMPQAKQPRTAANTERLRESTAKAQARAKLSAAYERIASIRTFYGLYLGRIWAAPMDENRDERERTQEETMRIDLDLPDEAMEAIRAEAGRRGLTPEDYVARVIDGIANLADLITPQETAAQNEPDETYQETAEEIIRRAFREFTASQIQNRERAVKAMTQKNCLAAEVEKTKRLIAHLEHKSHKARIDGNRDLALAFFKERAVHQRAVEHLTLLLAEATEFADRFKADLRRQEEQFRQRAAEAMLLQMSLKTQIYAFRYNHGEPGASDQDVGADFERWAAEYEREQQDLDAAFANRSEDVETTLSRLEEALNRDSDAESDH